MKTKKVNKEDYEVFNYLGGYFGICKKFNMGLDPVLGGDSGNEDDYNLEYIQKAFNNWDSLLVDNCGKFMIQV